MEMVSERRADPEDLGTLVNVGLSVDEEEVRAWFERQQPQPGVYGLNHREERESEGCQGHRYCRQESWVWDLEQGLSLAWGGLLDGQHGLARWQSGP